MCTDNFVFSFEKRFWGSGGNSLSGTGLVVVNNMAIPDCRRNYNTEGRWKDDCK